jgi:hypothetical protein
MTIKQKIQDLKFNQPEDLTVLDSLLEEVKASDYPKELLETLLNVLENNPHFNFGMPGNIVRAIEKYYKEAYYQDFIIQSIERTPTEYNLWLLNRLLNSFEDEAKERGLTLFRKIEKETEDEEIKSIVQDFLSDYDE